MDKNNAAATPFLHQWQLTHLAVKALDVMEWWWWLEVNEEEPPSEEDEEIVLAAATFSFKLETRPLLRCIVLERDSSIAPNIQGLQLVDTHEMGTTNSSNDLHLDTIVLAASSSHSSKKKLVFKMSFSEQSVVFFSSSSTIAREKCWIFSASLIWRPTYLKGKK